MLYPQPQQSPHPFFDLLSRLRDPREWRAMFPSVMNTDAVQRLAQDSPSRRRKVYLEFSVINPNDARTLLEGAGFDMASIRHQKESLGFSCLIKGTSLTILKFLYCNPLVSMASIDLSEYSWLTACRQSPRSKSHDIAIAN